LVHALLCFLHYNQNFQPVATDGELASYALVQLKLLQLLDEPGGQDVKELQKMFEDDSMFKKGPVNQVAALAM
jgi:hypothetical protein